MPLMNIKTSFNDVIDLGGYISINGVCFADIGRDLNVTTTVTL